MRLRGMMIDLDINQILHRPINTRTYSSYSSDPMPPRLAHAPGHSDDTEAHTSTAQGPSSNTDEDGTCTTPRDPAGASTSL